MSGLRAAPNIRAPPRPLSSQRKMVAERPRMPQIWSPYVPRSAAAHGEAQSGWRALGASSMSSWRSRASSTTGPRTG
eukprot:2836422-Pyramimonas_sp.AAC.1